MTGINIYDSKASVCLFMGKINRGELLLDAEPTRQRPEVCGGPADRQKRDRERAHEGGRVSWDEESNGDT